MTDNVTKPDEPTPEEAEKLTTFDDLIKNHENTKRIYHGTLNITYAELTEKEVNILCGNISDAIRTSLVKDKLRGLSIILTMMNSENGGSSKGILTPLEKPNKGVKFRLISTQ